LPISDPGIWKPSMKRWLRRTLAVVVGLSLGWLAAGFLPSSLSATPNESRPEGHVHPSTQPAAAAELTHEPAVEGESGEHDAGLAAAQNLVPAPGSTPWLRPVLFGIAGLFVAALVVGLAVRAWGIRDPSIVATEEDQKAAHDDHAHDDHGHDSAGHH
jgi:hypothetical protein